MHVFVDYIQPITEWLKYNPNWALFITFIVSLTESLAIIGSIVPGSITMTAIGILAGSGIMRIDCTLIASVLGAVSGDSLSYALGFLYSDKLKNIWPFKKYPTWINYGTLFFERHGAKSVLIGRFVGPLRSIIPLVAGMMRMNQMRFLIANVLSAIGWSLLYVLPGVLIGTAGHELSAEAATNLFIIILITLIGIWLLSSTLKWFILHILYFLKRNLDLFWRFLGKQTAFKKAYRLITPKGEENHYATAGLFVLSLISILLSITLILLQIYGNNAHAINEPVNLLLQSLHTSLLAKVLIICTQFTSTFTIMSVYVSSCLWFIYNKQSRSAAYFSCLVIISSTLALILFKIIDSPRPDGLLITMIGKSFPNMHLLVATALYGFIFYYINNIYSLITTVFSSLILIILGLSGLGSIYLGDHWLSDVLASYLIGGSICLSTCLFYRTQCQKPSKKERSAPILISLFGVIIISTSCSVYSYYKVLLYAHTPYQKENVLTRNAWWNQKNPTLPLYRLNRVGKNTNILNIQYAGSLHKLKMNLSAQGWKSHNNTFFKKILMRIDGSAHLIAPPLLTQLYLNQQPELMMYYEEPQKKQVLQLMLWQSHYHIQETNAPIWIGTLYTYPALPNIKENTCSYLLPAMQEFAVRRIPIPKSQLKPTIYHSDAYILLIQSNEQSLLLPAEYSH